MNPTLKGTGMSTETRLHEAGQLLLEARLPGRAQAVFDRLLELDPGDQDARLGAVKSLLQQRRFAEAVEDLLKLGGDDPNRLRVLTSAALQSGDGDIALSAYQRHTQLTGEQPDPLSLAMAAYLQGDRDRCSRYVDKALSEEPGRTDAVEWQQHLDTFSNEHGFLVDVARHHLSRGNVEKALITLAEADEAGDSLEFRTAKAQALILSGGFEEALRHLRDSLGIYPNHPLLLSELGAVLLLQEKAVEAAIELDRALAAPSRPHSAMVRRAQAAVLADDASLARRWAEAALRDDSEDSEAWLVLAQAANLSDQHLEARMTADHAIALNPADPNLWIEGARLIRRAEPDLADHYAKRALGIVGSTEAVIVVSLDSPDVELARLEGTLESRPEFDHAIDDRTVIYEHLGLFERALAFQEASWRLDPTARDNPEFHVHRAMLLASAGGLDSAKASLRQALSLNPNHDAARSALAAFEVLAGG